MQKRTLISSVILFLTFSVFGNVCFSKTSDYPCVEVYDSISIGCSLENKETFQKSETGELDLILYSKLLNIDNIYTKIMIHEFNERIVNASITVNHKSYNVYRDIEEAFSTKNYDPNTIEILDKKWGKHVKHNACEETLKDKEFCRFSEKNTWFPKDSVIHNITIDSNGTINYSTEFFQKLVDSALKQQMQID